MLSVSGSPSSSGKIGIAKSLKSAHDNFVALAIGLAVFMTAIIAVSVMMHNSAVALASIPLFVFAILFFSVKDTMTAIVFYITYTAMEGMFKYMTSFSQVVYAIKPLLALAIFVGWSIGRRRAGEPTVQFPFGIIICLFVVWGACEIFNPLGSGIVSGLITFLVWYAIPIVFYIIGYNAFLGENSNLSTLQITKLLFILVTVSAVVSAFAFIQYGMGREWTLTHVPGYENLGLAQWTGQDNTGKSVDSFRPASTTDLEGFPCLWANLGILCSLGLLLLPGMTSMRKLLLLSCLFINASGLIVSGVRLFVFVSLLEVLLLFFLTSTSWRTLRRNLGIFALFAALSWLGFNSAQTISQGVIASRYSATFANPVAKFSQERNGGFLGQALFVADSIMNQPLGIGYQRGISGKGGAIGDQTNKVYQNRETQFAAVSGDMGGPGLTLFVIMVIAMLVYGNKIFRHLKGFQLKTLATTLFIALVGYTASFWGGPMLVAIGDYLWLFAGLLFALPAVERREHSKAVAADLANAG